MLFHTFEFAVFFMVVTSLYWAWARHVRLQNGLLLLSSYLFYGWWDYRFLFLIILSTAFDYCVALMIERGYMTGAQKARASLFALTGALFFDTIQWKAIHVIRTGWGISFATEWSQLLPCTLAGWGALIGTATLVAVGYGLYPWFRSMTEERRRRSVLIFSIGMNLGILGTFKYFNFFAANLNALTESVFGYTLDAFTLNVVLPVGISFYTFKALSYTIDIYRKEIRATDSLLELATFVAFFPQLIAGPIERARHLLPQFFSPRTTTWEDWKEGAWLIAWGLYKKIVIADNVAIIVNNTFNPYDSLSLTSVPEDGLRCLVAVYAFAFQIYGDFSGYSDIARGTGRILGFDIMVNFNIPYAATSPSNFWQRWHISLSSWLRDYLYIPLGGNKHGNVYCNLMLTMLLGGLWHGAAWTFIAWGAYQGALLVAYRVVGLRTEKKIYPRWVSFLLWLLMFHLVCIGWLLFRAQNMTTIAAFLQGMFFHPNGSPETWTAFKDLLFYVWFLVGMEAFQFFTKRSTPMERLPWFARLNMWIMVIMSLLALASSNRMEFIYFAF